jgi:hypothetical protein
LQQNLFANLFGRLDLAGAIRPPGRFDRSCYTSITHFRCLAAIEAGKPPE